MYRVPAADLPPWLLQERRALGGRIRTAREARGWTQPRLAERAEISRDSVYRTELGTRAASIDILLRIARALDVPLGHLTDGP